MNRQLPQTEHVNPRTRGLDELPVPKLVELLVQEQRQAVDAVLARTTDLARAVEVVTEQLRRGGRLHYVGAGTSGRIAFLDASEAPPTFGTPPDLVCAHIAGGPAALTRAVEGAEDNGDLAAEELRDHIGADDVVIGISASGSAAYVIAALITAQAAGAYTIAVANSPDTKLSKVCDLSIFLETGPEPVTGSTRMKAGTSQKLLLNALSTAVMVRLGKVYDNLMVDVVATNNKLRRRATRLVMDLTGLEEEAARTVLQEAGGRVKVAVVMARKGVPAEQARRMLEERLGSLRASL